MWSNQVAPHLDLNPTFPANAPLLSSPARVRGAPGILGQYPASCLAEEIDTPGKGQIKALLTLAANPVLSAPAGERLSHALEELDCMVSLDIYINETTRHAHVILPSPSLLEQAHWDVWAWPWCLTSGGHYSAPVFTETDRPPEWQVMTRLGAIFGGDADAHIDELDDQYFAAMCDQLKVDKRTAFTALPERGPERILDLCIRTGPFGDQFGASPEGLTLAAFKANPDGILLGHAIPQGQRAISTPSGKIELTHPHFLQDIPRLEAAVSTPQQGLRLVSRRRLGSLNSWMHNIKKLVAGRNHCTLLIHPQDAQRHNIASGEPVLVKNICGELIVEAEISENIMPGIVCLPHGWGHHQQGTKMVVAGQYAGINSNRLSPAAMTDAASGNAVLNGIPVHVEPWKLVL
jgi:anaerobic selenocysteine-containing dehydrogenase